MLNDPKEIEIISKAQQKNVRDFRRSRKHFENIFNDFLSTAEFFAQDLLDLGPGQYDFGEIAKRKGANVYCIDKDPAVIELGEYKGFNSNYGNLKSDETLDIGRDFDGIFCKFSVNAFWFHQSHQVHSEYVEKLSKLVSASGWAWIAPWNGIPKDFKDSSNNKNIEKVLVTQIQSFVSCGFKAWNLSEEMSIRYGIHGNTANRILFLKNLALPSDFKDQFSPIEDV